VDPTLVPAESMVSWLSLPYSLGLAPWKLVPPFVFADLAFCYRGVLPGLQCCNLVRRGGQTSIAIICMWVRSKIVYAVKYPVAMLNCEWIFEESNFLAARLLLGCASFVTFRDPFFLGWIFFCFASVRVIIIGPSLCGTVENPSLQRRIRRRSQFTTDDPAFGSIPFFWFYSSESDFWVSTAAGKSLKNPVYI